MTRELPQRGSVIRYTYLWADENASGAEEGRKDRPAIVLALSVREVGNDVSVLVVAVTHSPPTNPADCIPFPADAKRLIGLDDLPSWIVTTEANAFTWPGPDVHPVPGRIPSTMIYGTISERLLATVVRSYLGNREKRRSRTVQRTE